MTQKTGPRHRLTKVAEGERAECFKVAGNKGVKGMDREGLEDCLGRKSRMELVQGCGWGKRNNKWFAKRVTGSGLSRE